ncbi:MAG TPA: hypothetical protein VGY54_07865 [Polyangiaceae bacterium]|nr:hypothetical protein [Polyangiaceae bacterium]
MQNRRLSTKTLLCVTFLALAHCGGDSSGPGAAPESGAPDGAWQDASSDSGDAVSDHTMLGADADAFFEAGIDATDFEAGIDATDAYAADAAEGGDSSDATLGADDAADALDAGTDVLSDGADGVAEDAADVGPVRLTCGSQVCNAGEFCGTPPVPAADAGDGGDATTWDGPSDGAADGSAPDATGSVDATADQSSPDDGSSDAAADDGDGSPEGAANANAVRCETATFANLCHNQSATIFFDSYDADNQSALLMATALQDACQVTVISPARNDAGAVADPNVLDPVSGQAKTGIGNLCLIGGGSFGQRAVAYIDSHSQSNVVVGFDTTDAGVLEVYFTDRTVPSAPKKIGIEAPYSATNNTHDYFLLQLTVDPATGTLCLEAMGLTAQGTIAAGYYAAKHLIESGAYATSSKSWLIYEWTDEDDGGVPDDNDTYALVASGP